MIKFVFQFFFLLLLWNSNRKAKGDWLTSSSVLIGIYAICAFCGIFALRLDDFTQPYEDRYWLPMLEFDLLLLLFLLPFRLFQESSIKQLALPSKKILDIFSTIIIILSFYSILFFISSVRGIFMMADLSAARNAMVAGEDFYFETGIYATIASVSAANYVFAIVLFFIYQIIGGSKLRSTLLLISSLSEPIHILAFVGRDGVVFWIFTFLFCYAFFRPYLPKVKSKTIIRTFIKIGLILLVPFLLISISRFGKSDAGTGGSFISYLGQGFIQGPVYFGLDNKPLTPGAGLPLFRQLLGMPEYHSDGPIIIGDWISYRFSTFIVSLYLSLDIWGLVWVLIFIYLLFSVSFGKVNKKIKFSQFVIYLLYFQVVGQGVFYFKHYTRGGNLFIMSTLALALLFTLIQNSNNQIVVEKNDAC